MRADFPQCGGHPSLAMLIPPAQACGAYIGFVGPE
jgi:hypothetical protein